LGCGSATNIPSTAHPAPLFFLPASSVSRYSWLGTACWTCRLLRLLGTIGSLALILVYIGVNTAELTISFQTRRTAWFMCGLVGTGVLFWPLYTSVHPTPAYPNNRWPYLVARWVIGGIALPFMFPALEAAPHRDANK